MGLGSLKYVDDATTFVLFSFAWKFLCGVGAGLNSTASFAIIASHYKQDREKMIGMMESSSGIGLLMGPFFGAILYQIGGYMLPFFVTGKFSQSLYLILTIAGMYFAMYPLIAYSLSRI
jgi:MFS family permease